MHVKEKYPCVLICFYKFNIHKLNKLIQTKEGESHVMVQSLFDI
jgi:hypothetical protein